MGADPSDGVAGAVAGDGGDGVAAERAGEGLPEEGRAEEGLCCGEEALPDFGREVVG